MGKTRFKMPDCAMNPITERPYRTHKWKIIEGRLDPGRDGLLYYHVVCARPACGIKSRNPVAF